MSHAKHLLEEFKDLFLGDLMGSGMSRKVYVCGQDDQCVVKLETRRGYFQNIREWETWQELQHTKAARWLAPCVAISGCGTILLQRRVQPIRKTEAPKMMPAFMTDFKLENFGLYEGRIVCCDYGTNLIITNAINGRMKKADW